MHVTVARVYEFEEALLLRSVLEAGGLEVFLPDEFTAQNTPPFLFANEGIRVQVKPEDEARAREILETKATSPALPEPRVVDLTEKLSLISKHWTPGIVADLNGQHVKLVKLLGEFVWHAHKEEDEMFLVLDGTLKIEFRDHTVTVERGQFVVVPRGMEHRPVAEHECAVMLFEPAATVNTGDAGGDRTVAKPGRL